MTIMEYFKLTPFLHLISHYLASRVYADHNALYESSVAAWNRFANDSELVSSLCHTAWVESARFN